MTGLLLKDLLCLRKQGKVMLLLIAFYLVLFFQVKDSAGIVPIASMIIVLLSTILVLNSFSYDELSKWDVYSLSLPIGKLQIVLCKYLLAVLLSGAGVLLCIGMTLIRQLLSPEVWLGVYAAFGAAMALVSLLIPLLFQFGVQRARLFTALIFLLPTASFLLLKNLKLSLPSAQTLDFLLKLSPVLLAAVILLSVFASVQIFSRKEL